ncbi:MAG: aldo/keto reductase [Candidatus Lokiarchaeota archaeon]|jgi:diketogulonate reductase-like aldo/keto reductase
MRKIELAKTGEMIPVVGQGLWGVSRLNGIFKGKSYYENIKNAVKKGIQLGMKHIDTAELYGMGKAESILGNIIQDYPRDELFITSKLFPMHFSYKSMKKAANKTLKRLGIDYLDLYLIHWPSSLISIEKEMRVLESLVKEGNTRYIGVSNFSIKQFEDAQNFLKKEELVNNQVQINITTQKFIHKSLSYYQNKGVTVTAYSPLSHKGYTSLKGDILEKLENLAKNHNATIQQVAIAWLINHNNVMTIPKAFNIDHVNDNANAADILLSKEEIELLYQFK